MVEQINEEWSDEELNLAEKHGVTLEMTPNVDIGPEGGEADVNIKITVPIHT
jgi:hypothetical protein